MTQPTQTQEHLYFIIGGAGRVGYFLAQALQATEHEVVLLEKDPRRVKYLHSDLGDVVERGDACEVSTLERVGCERADYLLAVTGEDEDNLVMCQIAKAGFPERDGKKRHTIARVNNIANIPLFERLGIDVIISPTQNILDAIGTELPLPTIVQLSPAANEGKQLIEVRVPADASANGKTLQYVQGLLPKGCTFPMLIRGHENFVPDINMTLQADDKLFAIVTNPGKLILQHLILGDHQAG